MRRYLKLTAYFLLLLAPLSYLFYSTYQEVKAQAIDQINAQQFLLARQAKTSIEDSIAHYLECLNGLAGKKNVIHLDQNGWELLNTFYLSHPEYLKAVTRVDAEGRIIDSVPYSPGTKGTDISNQEHIQRILRTRKAVASDVFTSIQGYRGIALHVPVFEEGVFQGSLAVLIQFDNLARKHLENIKIGQDGYAWLISGKGIELYCPVPEHLGRSIFETCRDFPSILAMAREMLQGRQEQTVYYFNQVRGQKVETIKKHAVYMPIKVADTFWSIVVATPESEALKVMEGFKFRWAALVLLLITVSGLWIYFALRSLIITGEVAKRHQAETALKETADYLRIIFDYAPDAVFLTDLEGNFVDANRMSGKLMGYDNQEMLGRNYLESGILPREELGKVQDILASSRAGRSTGPTEIALINQAGDRLVVEITTFPVQMKGENLILGIARDITARKRIEASVQLNLARLETLVKLSQMSEASIKDIADFVMEEAVRLTKSKVGYLYFMNEDETLLTVHSWSRQALAECRIENKQTVFRVSDTGLWGEAVRQRKPIITNDYRAPNPLKKGCPEGHVEVNRHLNLPVFEGRRIVAVAGVGNKEEEYDESDVNQLTLLMNGMWSFIQRKAAEDRIRSALSEKVTLLREIHHRVKNNMQVISSLLNLQINQENDARVVASLREAQNRVLAMALVHEALYRSESFAEIDLGDYLRGLTETLKRTYTLDSRVKLLKIESPKGIHVNLDQAIPCGLVLNELLTNSLKHAFPDSRAGEIAITVGRDGGGRIILTVRDNGVGLPQDPAWDKPGSLGLPLVKILVEHQLKGKLDYRREDGTVFTITLPPPEPRD
ncbi:MAG: GAF domain-containing protein [Thermodesulfobacteriota bacterium]